MGMIMDSIAEWLKEILVGGIISNLSGMFDSVNGQVGEIAVQVGTTPQAWNGTIYSMIRTLSENVMVPIAGVILAFVMTLELIQMVADKNNMHGDVDTWMYATYMSTLGNRPDLFPDSAYVNRYYNTEYEDYEIPAEALSDPQFAAMMEEAEKYLGYPYVWGGSSPSTSFDCSGFVSWVVNNCGVGWNIGRLGASGLLGICTRVSASNVRPGDLVFFEGTYDTTGASHVGIYVGNNRMLHCGDPIQYADLTSSYWQQHFLAYGRLPAP